MRRHLRNLPCPHCFVPVWPVTIQDLFVSLIPHVGYPLPPRPPGVFFFFFKKREFLGHWGGAGEVHVKSMVWAPKISLNDAQKWVRLTDPILGPPLRI